MVMPIAASVVGKQGWAVAALVPERLSESQPSQSLDPKHMASCACPAAQYCSLALVVLSFGLASMALISPLSQISIWIQCFCWWSLKCFCWSEKVRTNSVLLCCFLHVLVSFDDVLSVCGESAEQRIKWLLINWCCLQVKHHLSCCEQSLLWNTWNTCITPCLLCSFGLTFAFGPWGEAPVPSYLIFFPCTLSYPFFFLHCVLSFSENLEPNMKQGRVMPLSKDSLL